MLSRLCHLYHALDSARGSAYKLVLPNGVRKCLIVCLLTVLVAGSKDRRNETATGDCASLAERSFFIMDRSVAASRPLNPAVR
jgi:hypothetical protein